ncbi:MAG: PH domain-containing protein [Balneolaceae bacterium]
MNSISTSDKNRTIVWRSDWRYQLPFWAIGVLLLPIFGLGLPVLLWGYLRWRRREWIVHDQYLMIREGTERQTVSIEDLERARFTKNRMERRFGVGTLVLESRHNQWVLPWLRGAESASNTLNRAIQALATRKPPKPSRPASPLSPQRMDRMDELTSLWQQGLISDEDFDRERRHFET